MLQRVVTATSSLVLCVALFACSSKDGQPPSETVTPTGFTVEGSGPFTLLLSWQPPTATFDGFRLDFTEGGRPLQQIGTELIPPTVKAVRLVSQSAIPEAVHLRFALTAIRQGQPIGPGASVDFIEPLLAVYDLGALLVDGGIVLNRLHPISWASHCRSSWRPPREKEAGSHWPSSPRTSRRSSSRARVARFA